MPNNYYANEPNQSRSEEIIQSILDNTEYDEAARSRIEYLLIELKNAIEGGGGGGGVTSYSPLTEKPKIDNHTLQAGNNTSSDLGLQTKIDPENKLSADNVDDTNSTNKFNVKSDWNAASGATSEILNKPTLGTASAKNVPASGDAATGEVVLGSDTRLTDARNAKDVYNWAKQASKPTYSYSEIQNPPTIPDELSDLTDDSTHRTVTDTEKDTWNGKQNALTFDDAPTSNSGNPVKSGGVYTALSGKQNNLSEAQMAAANSGATADKINKIAVNENNISYNTNNGVKNYLPINSGATTGAQYVFDWIAKDIPAGQYIISFSTETASGAVAIEFGDSNTASYNQTGYRVITLPTQSAEVTVGANTHYVRLFANTALTITDIMLRPASISDASYQPYALSNAELTAKNAVNENNILSLTANGGGKNKLKITATSSAEMTINDDKTVSITVNTSTQKQYNLTGWIPNNYVGMKISGMTVNSNVSTGYFISVQYSNNGSSWANETDIATIGSATILDYPYINVGIVVRGGNNLNGVLFKPMISTEGEPYQPYALSNAELTQSLLPTSYSSPTLIDDSTCTINEGGYVTVGNIVVINVTFTTTESYAAYGSIMQFPVPKNSGSITMIAAAHIDSSVNVAVNKFGQLALFDTPLPAGTYHFFTVYLKQ